MYLQYKYAVVVNMQPKYVDMADDLTLNLSVLRAPPTSPGCGELFGIWLGIDHTHRQSGEFKHVNQKSIVIHN